MSDPLEARVDALFIYPIKACGAMRVTQLDITAAGLIAGDREWVVVDEKGEATWQGAHPRLAVVRPTLDGGVLRLTVQIWNDSVKLMESFTAFDAGDEAADLLRRVSGARLRLVRLGPQALARRGLNPVHLVSIASLDELNGHLASEGLAHAEALRFRPNLVLGPVGEPLWPFIEEQLTEVRGGEGARSWQMPVTALCVRCVVPGVSPETGALNEALPPAVAHLSAQRAPGGPSTFGVYAAPQPGAQIRVGDQVMLELAF